MAHLYSHDRVFLFKPIKQTINKGTSKQILCSIFNHAVKLSNTAQLLLSLTKRRSM